MNKGRIVWIDIAKGIGIILVVYGHALGGIMNSNGIGVHNSLTIPYNIIYGFHMPLFFFLAGMFVHNWAKRPLKVALSQKLRSLVIPYFVWTIITGSVMALVRKYTNSGLGVKDILLSPIAPFSEYWFLYVLFVIFVIYYLMIRLVNDKGLIVIAFLLFLMRPILYEYWIFDALSLNFLWFVLGAEFQKQKMLNSVMKYSTKKMWFALIVFVVVNILNLIVLRLNVYWIGSYYKVLTVPAGIMFVIYISQLLEKYEAIEAILSWLGGASMAIYVMHLIPIAGCRIIALKLIRYQNLFALSIIITLVALIVCVSIYALIIKTVIGKVVFGKKLVKY
ncbi:acyltransferase family protein [Lactiplantibacillus plantarum]|uniref:acyltransferase family protein n=1 Tax=Lactiplantibacillus plantarum TaxID=1590 RepID=UPI000A179A91|nr:acyltransferase [Lactiplantibacillus plantarum]ARK33798.1 hypothetical protein B5726_04825 [Lactiplantibacillus plantarum]MBO2711346.1 acyltransferase family protein [Lactiplantibacillus plantarum]MBS0953527.1 acyltransferase [Lactiplantibacillus plantarum]MCG0569307.1 acyltransferase/acetyltransferase [Lactiplantibacillus plantarum]MCG0615745.1 acyltransferase/acetyltransferase [Lactiplantibacillus plantarum]